MTTDTELYWDPIDPSLRVDPYPLWKRMRDDAPVWHNERYDFYALTRFADVEAAHRDWHTYSSAYGTTIEMMTAEPADSGMIHVIDPPKHPMLRTLVSRAFTVRRVAALETDIRQFCRTRLTELGEEGSFDYVQDFAALLPPWVIAQLLGVPDSDQQWLRPIVDDIFHNEDGVGMVNDTSITAMISLREYLGEQVAIRKATPADDMLTALVSAEIDDAGSTRRLTDDELQDFALLLFVAGTETVARLLGWAGSTLDLYPSQRALVAADLSLVPAAIEELLRFEPPSPVQARMTTKPVALHGVDIPAKSKVALVTGAAGRDDRAYVDPDRFDVARQIDLHVSFGYGIHFCIGAALARLETRIALEETLTRFPEWTVDRSAAEMLHTSTVRGYARLPLTVT